MPVKPHALYAVKRIMQRTMIIVIGAAKEFINSRFRFTRGCRSVYYEVMIIMDVQKKRLRNRKKYLTNLKTNWYNVVELKSFIKRVTYAFPVSSFTKVRRKLGLN